MNTPAQNAIDIIKMLEKIKELWHDDLDKLAKTEAKLRVAVDALDTVVNYATDIDIFMTEKSHRSVAEKALKEIKCE